MEAPVIERKGLSCSVTADALGISRGMVHKLVGQGKLRSFKCGTRTLIPPAAIDEYIAENSQ